MGETRRFPACGLSMLPSVYPRDILHVENVDAPRVAPGDLVAYPAADGRLTCHRVLRVQRWGSRRWFELRGDAQSRSEWIRDDALVYVVTRVDGRLGSWRAGGPRGRLLARLALSDHVLVGGARRAAARALSGYAAWRRGPG